MEINSGKKSIQLSFKLDVILAALFLIVPMVPYLNYLFRGLVFTWTIFPLWMIVALYRKKELYTFIQQLSKRKAAVIALLLFILILILNYLFVRSTPLGFQYLVIFINIFLIFILDTYYSKKPESTRMSIFFFIVFSLGLQAAISIPNLLSAPGYIARQLTSGKLDGEASIEAMKMGIGGSSLYLSLVPIFFLSLASLKKYKSLIKIILFISSIVIILSVFISSFFTPIAMFAIGLLILLWRYNRKIINWKFLLFTIVFILIGFYFYNNYVSDTSVLKPVIERVDGLISGDGEKIEDRASKSESSINTFLANPLIGIGVPNEHSYDLVGGHNVWVDFLAYFGFFGVLPFLFFLFRVIKKNIRFYFVEDKLKLYRTTCLIGLIIFIISNFIVPSLTRQSMVAMFFLFYVSQSNYNDSISK